MARTMATVVGCVAGAALLACGPDAGTGTAGPAALDTLIEVNGTRLFVHAEGQGEPILVIHGGPLLDHGYLVEPLRPLASDHRLVLYDQRLSGRSAGTVDSASVTLASFVADVEAVRSALGLEEVHLLGHSWGGLLAMKYALAHPSRLRSLVLLSPMPPSAELWQREQTAVRGALQPGDTAGMAALGASEDFRAGEPAAIERMLRLSFRSQLADPADAAALDFHVEDDYRERSRQFGFLRPELAAYDLTDSLPGLPMPILVVYGAAEVGAGVGADTLATLLPDAEVETIPEAGHFAFLERPEAFLPLLRRFLSRSPAP